MKRTRRKRTMDDRNKQKPYEKQQQQQLHHFPSSFCHFNLFVSLLMLTIHFGCRNTTVCSSLYINQWDFLMDCQNVGKKGTREMYVCLLLVFFFFFLKVCRYTTFFVFSPAKRWWECKMGPTRSSCDCNCSKCLRCLQRRCNPSRKWLLDIFRIH